jgi:hypothetical protein
VTEKIEDFGKSKEDLALKALARIQRLYGENEFLEQPTE